MAGGRSISRRGREGLSWSRGAEGTTVTTSSRAGPPHPEQSEGSTPLEVRPGVDPSVVSLPRDEAFLSVVPHVPHVPPESRRLTPNRKSAVSPVQGCSSCSRIWPIRPQASLRSNRAPPTACKVAAVSALPLIRNEPPAPPPMNG